MIDKQSILALIKSLLFEVQNHLCVCLEVL